MCWSDCSYCMSPPHAVSLHTQLATGLGAGGECFVVCEREGERKGEEREREREGEREGMGGERGRRRAHRQLTRRKYYSNPKHPRALEPIYCNCYSTCAATTSYLLLFCELTVHITNIPMLDDSVFIHSSASLPLSISG